MTIRHEIKLDSDELFNLLIAELGRDEFIDGIIRMCCEMNSLDLEFEQKLVSRMQKFISDNT